MSWSKTSIDLPLLNGIDDILASLNSGASSLETILGTASTALDAAKVAFLASADPFSFIFEALLNEVENLINDTFNSSASVLIVNPLTSGRTVVEEVQGEILSLNNPFTFSDMQARVNTKSTGFSFDKHGIPLMTPTECINEMISSFDDLGDENRPQISTSGQVAAFGVIATAPDLSGFIPLLNGILQVFNLAPFANILNDFLRKANLDINGNTQVAASSRQPDWYSARLSSIDALGQQRNQLLRILNLLRGYVQSSDSALVVLINTIQRKIENLLSIIQEFNDLITQLRSVTSASGIWSFSLPSATGGVPLIQERLRLSANDPDVANTNIFQLTSGYTVGALFVGGGPSLTAVETIRDLMFETAEVITGDFFDEIQVITFSTVPDDGTWRLEFNNEETVDLAFDASSSAVQTALRNLNSLADVEVQGNYSQGFSIRFAGSDGQKDQPDLTIADPGSNEVQKISFTARPDAGQMILRFNPGDGAAIEESPAINFNATAATVQAALEAIPSFGVGNVAVSGSYINGFTVTWLGLLASTEIAPLTYSKTLQAESRTVNIEVIREARGRAAANNLLDTGLPVTVEIITTRQGKGL